MIEKYKKIPANELYPNGYSVIENQDGTPDIIVPTTKVIDESTGENIISEKHKDVLSELIKLHNEACKDYNATLPKTKESEIDSWYFEGVRNAYANVLRIMGAIE